MRRNSKFKRIGMVVVLGAIPIAALAAASLDLARRMESTADHSGLPAYAVVFTGQFDRVRAGLNLLEHGEIQQLLVTGVNPDAGMTPARFADQFHLGRSSREALAQGRLVLGPAARSTLQNVSETRCWLESRGLEGPVLLITSAQHMPRASVALEIALPGRDIRRLSVPEGEIGKSIIAREFLGYVATLAVMRIPFARWLSGDASKPQC